MSFSPFLRRKINYNFMRLLILGFLDRVKRISFMVLCEEARNLVKSEAEFLENL